MEEAVTTTPQKPATAGGAIECPSCGRANPPARRFCGGCGQSLWQQCPACSAECAADERFCGACGADIQTCVLQENNQHQQALEEALKLAEQLQYDEALAALLAVAELTDPRLQEFAQRAAREAARIRQAAEEQRDSARAALAEGQKFLQAFAYEQAIAALDRTPPPLRTEEHSLLLARATACRQEVQTLSGEIRTAVEQKQFDKVLPKLERLLALKPNQPQARQMAEQLRDSLVRLAAARLSRHKYQEALDQLTRIPLSVRTPEAEALELQARERLCLLVEAQQAALADQNLVALAARFHELAPEHPLAAKLRAQAAERAAKPAENPRLGAANWAPPPARTPLGPPVDWLAHLQTPVADAAVSRALRDHPGQFFVALGLALQALDLAACDVNLLPRETGGLLGSLPALNLSRRAPTAAWGLDLSDTALKAVKVVRDAKTSAVQIVAAEYIPQPASPGETAATIASFADRAGELKGVRIAANIPGSRVLGRFFELPPLAARKVADAVQFEARHQLPMALESLCWGYAIQDPSGKAADDSPQRILVQASRDVHVKERLAAFKNCGIAIDVLQSDCVAMHNALIHELAGAAFDDGGAVAAIDVGAECTSIVVSSPRCVWFRTIGLGGRQFSRALCSALQITHEQAEQIKREPARAASFRGLCEAWRPLQEQLTSEVERSLASYHKLFPEQRVIQLYGLGGAFQTHGVLRHLRTGS